MQTRLKICAGFLVYGAPCRVSPEQSVVGKAKDFLEQDREEDPKNQQAPLKTEILRVTGLYSDEPHQRGQEQRQQPEKRSETNTQAVFQIMPYYQTALTIPAVYCA